MATRHSIAAYLPVTPYRLWRHNTELSFSVVSGLFPVKPSTRPYARCLYTSIEHDTSQTHDYLTDIERFYVLVGGTHHVQIVVLNDEWTVSHETKCRVIRGTPVRVDRAHYLVNVRLFD